MSEPGHHGALSSYHLVINWLPLEDKHGKEKMRRLWGRLSAWYQGEWIPYENEPGSSVVFIGGFQRRPRLALAIETVFKFWGEHWKWLIGIAIAIAAIVFRR